MTETIRDELWWIVPGKLAGVRKPTPEELPELRAAGVDAIVSVMDDPSNLDAYDAAGLPRLWLPVTGGTAPTMEQVAALREFVDARSGGVAVHCTSGRRRTGTMLAAYLIATGQSAEASLAAIAAANPEVELREAQISFLHALPGELS